jgi:polysaccharide biosynthesis protein PslH
MRTLYVSPRQAWPAISGAKLRDFHLARALGQAGELTWVFYQNSSDPPLTAAELPFCRQWQAVPRPPLYTPAKLVRGLSGPWSLPVVNYTSPQMISVLRQLLQNHRFDAIHVDSVHLAACVEAAVAQQGAATPVFYNWHNIESELMRRYSVGAAPAIRRFYARFTAAKLKRDEAHILNAAAGHIVCSQREQELLLRQAPESRIAVIENGVDAAFFANPPHPHTAVRNRLVFVGSMSYHANADAAVWFAREVWPGLHRRFQDWTLTLVGSDPGEDVRALAGIAGVQVTGTVPDVRPYYQTAFAAVVPLRTSGGTRLKILEALAAGVPVISTAEGAEGLAVQPNRDFLLAQDCGQWLPLLESLLEERRAEALRQAGLELIHSRYDWQTIGAKLVATYRAWLDSTDAAKGRV